jgi:EmrB/QacA subfamily drug resistance transporter
MKQSTNADRSQYRWIVLSVAFAAFMSKLDTYIVNVSLPTISKYFNVGTSEVSRVILVYLLVLTSTLLLFGRLGDKFGQKKIFVLGYFFFTLGSLLCGLSPSIQALVAFRGVQGLGGAMLLTSGYAIIPKFLPDGLRGWGFGIVTASAALGISVGAPLGGLITGIFSWHWIFLINLPVGVVAILVAHKVLPADAPAPGAHTESGFDIQGTVLSLLGISARLYALNMGQEQGWTSSRIVSCSAVSVIFLTGLFVWESRCEHPLLDLSLFMNRDFAYANVASFLAFMLLAANVFLIPFYLELVKDLKTEQAGLLLTSFSLVYIAISPWMGRIADKVNPRLLCAGAMLLASSASLVFALALQLSGLLPVIIFLVWLAVAYALFISPNNKFIMSLPPADKRGAAAGAFNTMNNLSQGVGICLFETVFSQALPQDIVSQNANLAKAAVPNELLLLGFRNAYIVGGIVCLAALVFTIIGMNKKRA